jgi:sulfide dehydrogenase cytochrome subunit
MSRLILFSVLALSLAPLSPAGANELAGACANCHGTDGRSQSAIPPIAGRPEATLLAQLKAFRSDTPPPGTTIMNRLVKGYSDEQLEALAKYFANVKPAGPTQTKGKK